MHAVLIRLAVHGLSERRRRLTAPQKQIFAPVCRASCVSSSLDRHEPHVIEGARMTIHVIRYASIGHIVLCNYHRAHNGPSRMESFGSVVQQPSVVRF